MEYSLLLPALKRLLAMKAFESQESMLQAGDGWTQLTGRVCVNQPTYKICRSMWLVPYNIISIS